LTTAPQVQALGAASLLMAAATLIPAAHQFGLFVLAVPLAVSGVWALWKGSQAVWETLPGGGLVPAGAKSSPDA
jgi:hypothetical protein